MRLLPLIRLGALLAGGLYLTSYSAGPTASVGDLTGSPLSGITCNASGCHGGGEAYAPDTEIEVLGADGETVSSYTGGTTYTLRVSCATTGTPGGYGFQAVALRGADDTQAGVFGEAPEGFGVTPLGGRDYLEHRRRSPGAAVEIPWTAPAEPGDSVRFYAIVNAVNGNGNSNGDYADAATLTLPPVGGSVGTTGGASAARGALSAGAWRAWQSADAVLHVALPRGGPAYAAPWRVRVSDLAGRVLAGATADGPALELPLRGGNAGPLVVTVADASGRRGSRLVHGGVW